ncbi:hypothetical protein LY78DRAFT_287334 [Colletotrichum sublineola]|nr:hypothetical protein LY78DRAFT_287334 [Colletotrichum sublineola]
MVGRSTRVLQLCPPVWRAGHVTLFLFLVHTLYYTHPLGGLGCVKGERRRWRREAKSGYTSTT